jgi:hypothetical protein
MDNNQTHPVHEVKPPPLFDKIISTVNSSAPIQCLLYDLGLLPEQTMGDPLQWARTGSIALELAERDEQIRALRIQVKQADERGDEAMRMAHNAESELTEARKLLDAALHELAYGTHTMAKQFNRESP